MSVSRRVTLGWIAAASSTTALLGCDSQAPKAPKVGRWEDVALQPLTAPGYGQDPNLVDPMVPWPLTLNPSQRETLRIAADLMLPEDAPLTDIERRELIYLARAGTRAALEDLD